MHKRACLLPVLLLWSCAAVTSSQVPAAPATPSVAAPAPDPTHGITFDVVSIRKAPEGQSHIVNPVDGDGITIDNSTLLEILRWNFNNSSLRENQLQGAPPWVATQNYAIRAKVAAADIPVWKTLGEGGHRLVFRKMLQDRFKLAWRNTTVDQPIYNLVLAKGGPKFKAAGPDEVSPYAFKVDGQPYKGTGVTMRPSPAGGGMWVMQQAHMSSFAKNFLSEQVGRQVVDKTGLTGAYNFTLDYAWQGMSAASPDAGASEPSKPDIFTALQEQLGLKLEPARGPVGILVFDHVEQPEED